MKTERLYYRDSYLRTFEAEVIAHESLDGRPAVVLDRTAFYPTSGGQPHDTGMLAGARVVDVVDREDVILHVLEGAAPEVCESVVGEIDWEQRLDHMQQHAGQHVLSQCFDARCQAPTVSFHLGEEYCTIDIARTPLSAEQIAVAERLANQIVLEDRPIVVHFATGGELERFALRKATEREGEVRVIEVERFDFSACGGTHCARTGEIGPIKVRRWERRGADTRVEFVCGWRALNDYAMKHDLVRGLAEGFRVRDRDLAGVVQKNVEELRVARDTIEDLRARLQVYEADELLAKSQTVPAGDGQARVVVASLSERTPDEVKRLAQRLTAGGGAIALLGLRAGERAHLVFAQSPGLPFDVGKLLREACADFGGRGGGSRDLAQGGLTDASRLDEALARAAGKLELAADAK